jgi:hypothetical protein
MGEFGVIVEGGCHFFYSDQGPLLKGGGDVGNIREKGLQGFTRFYFSYVQR